MSADSVSACVTCTMYRPVTASSSTPEISRPDAAKGSKETHGQVLPAALARVRRLEVFAL